MSESNAEKPVVTSMLNYCNSLLPGCSKISLKKLSLIRLHFTVKTIGLLVFLCIFKNRMARKSICYQAALLWTQHLVWIQETDILFYF